MTIEHHSSSGGGLRPPKVPAEAYTETYYRHHCGPHDTWNEHEGRVIDGYYHGMVEHLDLHRGERLVDLGAGRGELLVAAVQSGAACAVGVEYSLAAVALAERTLRLHGVGDRAKILHGDVRDTDLQSGDFDVVALLDVVEHLAPAELDETLAEARRLLKPGGRVAIHTLPNRLVYDVTYRMQRLARPSRRRTWPKNPRGELELEMHVNEQTLSSLRHVLMRAGFARVTVRRGQWVLDHMVPDEGAKNLYRRLAAHRLTAALGAADLWGFGFRS